MESLFATSISLLFESNGKDVLASIGMMARQANSEIKPLLVSTKALDLAFLGVAADANKAASGLAGFGVAARGAAAGASEAAGASQRAAAGFRDVGAAAAAAAGSVERYRASMMLGAGYASRSAIGSGERAALGLSPAMISGSGALALGGMQNAASAAGGMGGGFGGGGTTHGYGGGRPFPTGVPWLASGGSGGGGGMGSGGSGGGGGFSLMPPGGVPGFVTHAAIRGAEVAGVAVGGALLDGVYNAEKLQTILVSTKTVLGATNTQMDRIRQAAFNVGDSTGVSAVESAEMFRELARQSAGSMSIKDMLGLFPQISKAQTVLGATRGMKPAETVDSVMALTHLFRAYDPKDAANMAGMAVSMGELMPTNLTRAVKQLTLFVPTLKSMHVKNDEAAALMVLLSRAGMGAGKGGAEVADLFHAALAPLQLTAHAQGGKAKLLGPGELNVIDAHGNSRYFTDKGGDPFGFLTALERYAQRHGSVEASRVFQGAFGTQGSRLANLIADPIMLKQYENVRSAIVGQKSLSLDSQASAIFGTAGKQTERAFKNLESVLTEVGWTAVPGVTRAMSDLGTGLHLGQRWLHEHRALELKVQADILGGVKGTESWIAAHRQDWLMLRNDLRDVYGAAAKAGPAVGAIADALMTTYRDFSNGARGLAGLVANTRGVLGSVAGGIDWGLGRMGVSDRGFFPGPQGSPTGSGSAPVVNHFHGAINVHGVQRPEDFARGLHAATQGANLQHRAATFGHQVTSARLPRPTTTSR